MRHIVGGRAKAKQAASTSQMGRFETDVLTQPKNLSALMDLCGRGADVGPKNSNIVVGASGGGGSIMHDKSPGGVAGQGYLGDPE